VNEIVSLLNMGQSRVSRHLKILSDAGLLASRKEGLRVFYSLAREGFWGRISGSVFDELAGVAECRDDAARLRTHLSERAERGMEYFNTIAADWNRIRRIILGGLDLDSKILGCIGRGMVVADLGCGSGELAFKLLTKADRVIGVDRSPAMLAEARRLLQQSNGRIDLRLGELDHLPLLNAEVDAVVISMVLHYLDEQQQAVNEAGRVLRPGGLLIIAELKNHENEKMRSVYGHRRLGFSKETAAGWIKSAGLFLKSRKNFKAGEGLTAVVYVAEKMQKAANIK
jgi:ArsR family transcriptional regulator